MKQMIAVAMAAVVGGCAMTPAELEKDGIRSQTSNAASPAVVANCFSRAMRNESPALMAQTTDDGPNKEVAVYGASGAGQILVALAKIAPSGSGSSSTLLLYPHMLASQDEKYRAFLTGC